MTKSQIIKECTAQAKALGLDTDLYKVTKVHRYTKLSRIVTFTGPKTLQAFFGVDTKTLVPFCCVFADLPRPKYVDYPA